MARAAKRFEDALVKQANAASRLSPEFKIIEAAMLGLGDSTISLIKSLSSTSGAFASVSASGATAFNGISGAAAGAASAVDQRIALIVAKVREARAQAEGLRDSAKGENSAGTLSDDGLKQKLAGIKLTQAAYAELAKSGIAQELAAQQVADAEAATLAKRTAAFERLRATVEKLNYEKSRSDTGAERISSFKGAISAIDGASSAQAAAQAQVYLASLIAIAAQTDVDAQAKARATAAVTAFSAAIGRDIVAPKAAYDTKTAYIAKINEEAAALFRTKDAQRALDAERAGVSSQQAAQLAKFSGDRAFIATIYDEIIAEKKKGAEFGKTATEIFKQEAALRGLTNTAASAISRFDALAVANQKVAASAAKSSEDSAFLQGLKNTEAQIGKTRAELLAYQAAQRGLGTEAAGTIASIAAKDLKVAREGFNAAGNAAEHFGLQSVGAKRELLVLVHELSQGNYSRFGGSLLVLAERTNAAELATSLFTGGLGLAVIGIGTAVAAVGALAVSYAIGAHESKVFADSLVITGGYAGVTEGQFNSLAKGIAASSHVSTGAAREFAQALISTGQVGLAVFGKATQAAALYGKATGQDAKTVAADFASMGANAAAWAAKHNESLNFVTVAQYAQIKAFQESGRAADAQGVVYDALIKHFKELEPNLGSLERALGAVGRGFKSMWDAAFDIGRTETIEEKITKLQSKLQNLQPQDQKQNPFAPAPGSRSAQLLDQQSAPKREAVKGEIVALQSDQGLIEQAAAEKATRAALTKTAIEFDATAEKYKMAAKAGSEKEKARKALFKYFADQAFLGAPVSKQDQADEIRGLNKGFEDRRAITDGDAQRKSDLAKSLQGYAEELANETDALKFHQSELQAIYAAGNVSLVQFYDDKAKTTAEGVRAEIAAQDKATARLNAELTAGNFKNPHERTDTEKQRNESIAKSANLARDADHGAALAVYERAAAVKVLAQQVDSFAANLLQLEGDDVGAAALRATATIEATKLLQKKASGSANPITDADVAREEHAIKFHNALTQVSGRASIATADAARAEEAYGILARKTGATLLEQDSAVYAIRTKLVDQLADTAIKTQAVADANKGNAEYQQRAADAALALAKAYETLDPAMTRLRDASKALATTLVDDIASFATNATSLKDQFKKLGNDLFASLQKTFVTEPLKVQLQGVFSKFLDSDNPIAGYLKGMAGVKDAAADPQKVAALQAAQALDSLTAAVNAASGAIGGRASFDLNASFKKYAGTSNDQAAANYENEMDKANRSATASATDLSASLVDTRSNAQAFSGLLPVASLALSALGSAGGLAGRALSILPQIIAALSSSGGAGSGSGGGFAGLLGSLFGGGSNAAVSSGAALTANGFAGYANGGAFGGSVQAFARGDVFNSPTAFRFAKGGGFANGVMGEAGPEAVMPLRRGADGKLGVATSGGGASNQPIYVTNHFTVNGATDRRSQEQIAAAAGRSVQRVMARY